MLKDKFGRVHDYLRISLTERCNLRCFYCMPPEGVNLPPNDSLMNAQEIFSIARQFVDLGIKKIRLTGGEPMVRKDFREIVESLSSLPVELAITTNGILIDTCIDLFKQDKITKVNVSLDTLNRDKYHLITHRDYFDRVVRNIDLLLRNKVFPKINVVLIKGTNDDEINGFVKLTQRLPIIIQFIEFMPFKGNSWDLTKCVRSEEIIQNISNHYGHDKLIKLNDLPNDTSRKYQISGHKGKVAFISSVTNPFCESCNRVRLSATGKIKNCLFSNETTDILSAYRKGEDIRCIIEQAVLFKKKKNGGLNFNDQQLIHAYENSSTSMVSIGG